MIIERVISILINLGGLGLGLLFLIGGIQADPWSYGSRIEAENEFGMLSFFLAIPSSFVAILTIAISTIQSWRATTIAEALRPFAVRLAVAALVANLSGLMAFYYKSIS